MSETNSQVQLTERPKQDVTLVGKPPHNLATKTMAETTAVRTHDVANIPDSWFWSAHTVGLTATIVGLVIIALTKGPRRLDALRSFQANQEPTKTNPETEPKSEK
jgi:hypothetical protein